MNLRKCDIIESPDLETPIWRYMDLAKFIDLITHKHLFFPNGATLSDQYEGSIPDALIESKKMELKSQGLEGRDLEEELFRYKFYEANSMINLSLINCWTAQDEESYALWKIYLGGQQLGCAIKSTVGQLIEAIEKGNDPYPEDYYIGKVQYSECLQKNENHRLCQLTRKMPFYKYENEVRLIILNYPRSEGGTKTPYPLNIGRNVRVDTTHLINNVYLSPFAPNWTYDSIAPALSKIDPQIGEKIKKSRIRDL